MTSEQIVNYGADASPAPISQRICPIKLRQLQSIANINGGVAGAASVDPTETMCPVDCSGPTEQQVKLFGRIGLPFQNSVCGNPDSQQ